MVSTEPLWRPASLNFTTRLLPDSEADVAFLMKWGLPARAGTAARASAISDSTARTEAFLIGVFLLYSVGPYFSQLHTRMYLPGRLGTVGCLLGGSGVLV